MWVDFVARMLILSSWPAIFVCPAYSLLRAFRVKCFKVRGCLLCQEVAAHLFNRENSAFYCLPWQWYPILFPTVCTWILGCFNISKPSKRNRRPNSTFQQWRVHRQFHPVIPELGHYDGPEYQRGSVKYSSSVASVDGRRCSRNAVR